MKDNMLTRYILAVILIGLFGCGPTLQEKKVKADKYYEIGVAELKRGNLEGAMKSLEQAKGINAADAKVHDALGQTYLYQQQYEKAMLYFKKALQIDPNYIEAHNNLGATYGYQKDWDKAIVEFREVLKEPFYIAPALAHYNLGLALLERGGINDDIEAVKEFHEAVQQQPKFVQAINQYGVALYRLNRLQEAIKQFKQASELNPAYIDPYLNLGIVYMKQGKREDAIAQFKIVLEKSSNEEQTASARRYLEILE